MSGYLHTDYARAFSEFGTLHELPRCRGWVLERQIPGFPYYDAMGCYPIFCCKDWSQLHTDLEELGQDLVSLSIVSDPFGAYTPGYLEQCFNDIVIPFKEHFVVDLSQDMSSYVSSHHRRNARKALNTIRVEICQNPIQFIDEWVNLYSVLIERYNIRGISRFSRQSFAKQLVVPGLVMFRAIHKNAVVGITLWYVQGNVAYYHLGAYSDLGYQLGASFAIFWHVIEYFSSVNLRWLSLGAGAGAHNNSTDGLTRFKRGWSTETRPVYFCGHILDHEKYSKIVKVTGNIITKYFPAYRVGEFG